MKWKGSRPNVGTEWVIDVVEEEEFSPTRLGHEIHPDESIGGAQHDWHNNGLLTVNPDAPHPIYELVHRAEAEWEEKNAKASRTLEQAVEEYQRRYGRPPPLGFDEWWNYVVENDVRLPDEYDQIYRDLEPFWGIDPVDLIASQRAWEGHRDSWTIGKDHPDAPVTYLNSSLPEGMLPYFLERRISPLLELMGDLWRHVPPFHATFSPHDAPNERVDWTWKAAALDAAKRGDFLKPSDLPPGERIGWGALCPPGSLTYENTPPIGSWPTPQSTKTFIHDHVASMDVCQHPQHLLLHGLFLGAARDPIPERFPAPQFSYSSASIFSDIRAISLFGVGESDVSEDTRWEDKDDDRMVWRGGPTGMWHVDAPNVTWRNSQRLRLVNLTGSHNDPRSPVDYPSEIIQYLHPLRGTEEPVGEPLESDRGLMNRAMMDIGFAADYGNCEGVACDIMAQELGQVEHKSPQEMSKYKYFIDVDGNGWSSRFRRLMATNSLVFKSTLFAEWYSDRIQPWVHYVPIQLDYSDLYDALLFFAGDMSGEGAHDEMAKRMGKQGREWVIDYWREKDMIAYYFRLWLEYARVMSPDRKNMNFNLPTK
ncbi:hypothetical protein SCHPADRAFT_816612 [Schizopora paradoxa]|uniref:Glycosyl transferase CAP10 domain-containing protein n=1 Tax=Schizopora paradoxa TaxID=27342 RepID=A0A0H2ST82_9AGAM|nr:hypothetical protein SCHPADRAFT_816612 [Schizopora paradoxa]